MNTIKNIRPFALLLVLVVGLAACTPAATAIPTAVSEPTATKLPPTEAPEPTETQAPTATGPEAEPTVDLSAVGDLIVGRWEGALTVAGSSLGNVVNFEIVDNSLQATLDIPEQNLSDYPLSAVSFDGENVHFEAFEGNRLATWDGALNEDGTIEGTFVQAGYEGTFELFPIAMVTEELPYTSEDVTFQNGDITLAGTLTIPEGEGPFPTIVLITGSGAQNRDEEIYGFKIFGQIADHLTRNGIAVLRYDDRGVGGSSGELITSTSADLAGDVVAAVNYLLTRPEVDPDAIGLLGHSEGGIIAPMVAEQSEAVDMLILMAGTALPGEEIIYQQVERLMRAGGSSQEDIDAALEEQHRIFDALLRDGDWEATKAGLHQEIVDQVEALNDAQKEAIGDVDAYTETLYQQQVLTLESAWYRYFLTYDPAPTLEKTTIPVLALFGGLDMQVPADTNAPVMEAALAQAGNSDVTVNIYPQANHLFQSAITGSSTEYASLPAEFVPDFLDDITTWILAHASGAQ